VQQISGYTTRKGGRTGEHLSDILRTNRIQELTKATEKQSFHDLSQCPSRPVRKANHQGRRLVGPILEGPSCWSPCTKYRLKEPRRSLDPLPLFTTRAEQAKKQTNSVALSPQANYTEAITFKADSKRFSRCCITFRIARFLDFLRTRIQFQRC
jgi:hypothetical protein